MLCDIKPLLSVKGHGNTFLDAGSGIGNVLSQVALEGISMFEDAAGVEIDESRYMKSKEFISLVHRQATSVSLNFLSVNVTNASFCDANEDVIEKFQRASVVFANSLAFKSELLQSLLEVVLTHCTSGTLLITSSKFLGKSRHANINGIQLLCQQEYSSTFGPSKLQSYWIYKKVNATSIEPVLQDEPREEIYFQQQEDPHATGHHMILNSSLRGYSSPRSEPCRKCLDELLLRRPLKSKSVKQEKYIYYEARSASMKSKKRCATCNQVLCAEHETTNCKRM